MDNVQDDRVRIDKWLWAARLFKTRALAAKACDLGRVVCNGVVAKPAREVHPGDRLQVKTEPDEFELEVLALSSMRGPAAVAQTLYQETPASQQARRQRAEQRRAEPGYDAWAEGKPSKRDRRQIARLRGRG
jgi:ribosome-associated heat shock protein Hsp15